MQILSLIEIGNYDSFYQQGINFSEEKVLNLTKETKDLLPNIPLSVTSENVIEGTVLDQSGKVPPALTSPQVTTEPSVLTAAKAAVFV